MLAVLLLSLCQDPTAIPPAAAQVPAVPASDPAAAALLAAMAAAQHAAASAREVDGFDVQLNLRERGEQPNEFDLGLNYSRRKGENLRISLFDRGKGTRVEKGFDGKSYWLQEEDGPRRDLSAHEFAQDRASIDDALEFSADLLLLVDLASLARRAEGLRLEPAPAGQRRLAGQVRRGGHLWEFTLVLPAEDQPQALLPLALELREPNPDAQAAAKEPFLQQRRFLLANFGTFQGRTVPQTITEMDPAAADEEEAVMRILELRSLQWADVPLTPVEGPLQVPDR